MSLHYWIGLSASATEGTWLWLNGNQANSDDGSLWLSGRPRTGSDDCAFAFFGSSSSGLFVLDDGCSNIYRALCEKPV